MEIKTINKVVSTVRRPNGTIEVVDMTAKFPTMTKPLFRKIKTATKDAGRGDVIKIEHTFTATNYAMLEDEYRNGMLEGGEGYIPDMTKDPRFRVWEETVVFAD